VYRSPVRCYSDFGDNHWDGTMGNQQERSLAWLAGILDGEGSISIQVYTLPDGRVRLTPFVSIVNCDVGILTGCREVLAEIGVYYRDCKKPMTTGQFNGSLFCQNIRCDGEKPVRKLIEAVVPYLRSVKRRNAETILQYLDSRAKRLLDRDEKGRIRRVGYSRAEIELISSVRSHKRAKSSEAICQAPNVLG
jgi:hypothetical protein